MQKARDVIVLVVAREQTFRFRLAESKGRKRHRSAEAPGNGEIAIDQFAQRHHRFTSSCFGRHGVVVAADFLKRVYTPKSNTRTASAITLFGAAGSFR